MSCYPVTPYSIVTYAGNGVTDTFAIPFPYIQKADVTATVNGVDTGFTWTTDSTVKFTPAPANGATIRIARCTESDIPLVDFSDASTLTEADLDLSVKQELYLIQELIDALEVVDLASSDPNGVSPDIRTKVSATDTTTNYLQNKVLSQTGTITITRINPGAAEALSFDCVDPIRRVNKWIKITQNSVKTYIDGARDWRGMLFKTNGRGHSNTVANSLISSWDTGSFPISCWVIGANYAGADVQLDTFAVAAGTYSLWLEGGTGKIYVKSQAFASEFQVRVTLEGVPLSTVANTPDLTI